MCSVALVISLSQTELVVPAKNSNNRGLMLLSSSLMSSKAQFADGCNWDDFFISSCIKFFTIMLALFSILLTSGSWHWISGSD